MSAEGEGLAEGDGQSDDDAWVGYRKKHLVAGGL
jgi:hypothetical protein